MAWYVVEAMAGKDFEAHLRLAAAGLNVWRPVKRVELVRHVRVGGHIRKMKSTRCVARFGRYLFIELAMTDSIYHAVKHTQGVFGFLSLAGGDKPAEIDSRQIDFLRAAPIVVEKSLFNIRDRVKIKAGPFIGVEGKVSAVDKHGVVVVAISAFGGALLPIDACYLELLVPWEIHPREKRDTRRTRRHSVANV